MDGKWWSILLKTKKTYFYKKFFGWYICSKAFVILGYQKSKVVRFDNQLSFSLLEFDKYYLIKQKSIILKTIKRLKTLILFNNVFKQFSQTLITHTVVLLKITIGIAW